jgi:hypothetical protein
MATEEECTPPDSRSVAIAVAALRGPRNVKILRTFTLIAPIPHNIVKS